MNINDQAREELLQEVNKLTDEEINRKPTEGKWSIRQIMEHLVLMEGGIAKTVAEQLSSEDKHNTADKPIEFTINRETKVQAPEFMVPGDEFLTLDALKQKLAYTHEQLNQLAEHADPDELATRSYPHPVFGEMNLKQWIPFVGYHEKRHIEQIREVKEALNLEK